MQPPALAPAPVTNTQTRIKTSQADHFGVLEAKQIKAKEDPTSRRKEACLNCRSRKMRCGAEQPSCKTCLTWQRTCAYSTEKSKPCGTRSAAVLSAYLAGLEEKLQTMLPPRPEEATAPSVPKQDTSSSQFAVTFGGDSLTKTTPPLSKHADVKFALEDQEKILSIFFKYHHRMGCWIDPSRFFKALYAEDHNLHPHPALIDVMILTGILLAGLTMHTHLLPSNLPEVTSLLPQIHRKLGRSLELSDRVLDHLQASLILCRWYNYHNRLHEAQYLASACFSIAIDLKLHQMSSDIISEDLGLRAPSGFWDETILGPPRDHYEIYSRIVAFWSAYICERLMGLIIGLPTACDGPSITTIWPRSLDELGSICNSIQEGACEPRDLHSIKELLAGEIEPRPADGRITVTIPWKSLTLLGRAVELKGTIGSLGLGDRSGLEDAIKKINILANAIQVLDSSTSQVYQLLPPHQSLKSSPDARAWCVALEARVGICASHVHILRCIEAALKLLTAPSDEENNLMAAIEDQTRAAFMALVPKGGCSFVDTRFTLSRATIKLAHEVARQEVEDDPAGFETTRWITHTPYTVGYMLPPLVLAVVESIHELEAQKLVQPASSPTHQALSTRLEDAEQTFTQGMRFLKLLNKHMSTLSNQIEKIEKARYPDMPLEDSSSEKATHSAPKS